MGGPIDGHAMRAAIAGVLFVVALNITPTALAADEGPDVTSGDTQFLASWEDSDDGGATGTSSASGASPIIETWDEVTCAVGGQETCLEPALCEDGSLMTLTTGITGGGDVVDLGTSCPEEVAAPPGSIVTPGQVLRAFRAIDLPGSELVIQPPNGRTLVNLETNFYTEQGELTRSVRLLGRSVELAIWPERFVWRFGDGEVLESDSPGSPYPDLEITHAYRKRGRVAPSVDTTYAARFRVDGGAWREVPGTVTIPGSAESLRVVTARPLLVGG